MCPELRHLSHFSSRTIALTEFQNNRIDVEQTGCRFENVLRLNGFLTLMLQEVFGGELSQLWVSRSLPFLRWVEQPPGRTWRPSVPGVLPVAMSQLL